MPKFAVYYVPQEDDLFYHLGTQILGYDVRARSLVTLPSSFQESLGQLDEAWTAISRPYGFHLTIGDAIDCHWSAIPLVERELAELLKCFDPAHPFTFQRHNDGPVEIWGETGRHSLALLYDPNEFLRMFQTLIATRINPLGIGSGFLKRYLAHPEREPQPHTVQQIRLFYSPNLLGNWHPHFTLLNPYTGGDVTSMASRLGQLFKFYMQVTVQTVCLLIQRDDEANWEIYREFHR
jgi:hypothetical protein